MLNNNSKNSLVQNAKMRHEMSTANVVVLHRLVHLLICWMIILNKNLKHQKNC
jgi:hypothetical protein